MSLERKHLSQLFRYFTVTSAKFGILTNGRIFEFYTDLEEPNKLDQKPFFRFDLLEVNSNAILELSKFEKSSFDVERILANAERLKYISAVKQVISSEFEEPSDEIVRIIAGKVHEGRITAHVRDQVGSAIKSAYKDVLRDAVQQRLSSALKKTSEIDENVEEEQADTGGVVTTQDEVEGMMIIRAIVCEVIDPTRVTLRDSKSYCAILIDDNNRKPLCRLHFDRKQWQLSLFDSDEEVRVDVSGLSDIYKHSKRLRTTAQKYQQA